MNSLILPGNILKARTELPHAPNPINVRLKDFQALLSHTFTSGNLGLSAPTSLWVLRVPLSLSQARDDILVAHQYILWYQVLYLLHIAVCAYSEEHLAAIHHCQVLIGCNIHTIMAILNILIPSIVKLSYIRLKFMINTFFLLRQAMF